MHSATAGERVARLYASVVVALRYPIIVAWIAALVLALVFLPTLGGSGGAPISDLVPSDAPALAAQERALALFGSTVATDVVVVQRNARGLPADEATAHLRAARDAAQDPGRTTPGLRAAVPLVNVALPGLPWREQGTTALSYLFLDPDLSLSKREAAARRYAAGLGPLAPGSTRDVTGAGPARLAQFDEIEDALPRVEIATILVIFAMVAVYFRSLGAPLVTLGTAALAYVVAVRALAWAGERADVTAPSEIEPVLVVLLLGLVTDYTVFFMSETRRRLLRGEHRTEAARRAATRIAPIVLVAGVLVAAGAVSLLAGEMEFFRVFGPGLAACALIVTVVCVTLVPALIAVLGPWLFGRRVRAARPPDEEAAAVAPAPAPDDEPSPTRERWRLRFAGPLGALRASRRHAKAEGGWTAPRLITRLLTFRPVAVLLVIVVAGGLVVAASGARSADLAVSFIPSLPRDSEPRQGAEAAALGFVPGVLAPTDVIIEQSGIGARTAQLLALQRLVERERGVAAVLGPGIVPAPPLQRFVVAEGGGAARLVVLLDEEPTGADAIEAVDGLRDRMPALLREAGLPDGATVSFAGETALASETVDAMVSDLRRVAIVTAMLMLVLLALFLRSLVAPFLLLAGSVLAFAGSFGLTALLLPETIGGTDFVYYVPLVAAVLLVGLGSDYNVFIAGRIREEAGRRRLREAIAVGAPAASRAITVAGVTLAATFALLALVPLRPFRELALLMTIGVLIDALVVRPLLIPALISTFGPFTWWPSRPRQVPAARAFLERVAARTGQDTADARTATRATLLTLSERIPQREAEELARHLPAELVRPPGDDGRHGEVFGLDEFVRRVAAREGTSLHAAWQDARAVIATLIEASPGEELDYVRAALSEDYRPLFGDAPAAVAPGGTASATARVV